MHIYTKIKNYTRSPAHTHTFTHIHIQTNTGSCTQTNTHMHTQTAHAHASSFASLCVPRSFHAPGHMCVHIQDTGVHIHGHINLSHTSTHTDKDGTFSWATQYTNKHHMLPHTPSPPPMAPYTLQPSLPHSLERRELVKDARRQHADRVAVQVEAPGHETRRQSALTHSTSTCPLCPSACTCMCPMHMRHAHPRVQRGSLSLCAYARTVPACAHGSLVIIQYTTCDTCT